MTDKKLAAKRIILFVLFTYGLYWIFARLCDLLGILQDEAGFYLSTALAMLTPAAGSLLTRLVTKEGMANSLLRINFKGNAKYYLIGIFVPIVYTIISAFLSVPFAGVKLNGDFLTETGLSAVGYTAAVFANIPAALSLFPIFLGEELGWRGYLFPKLKTVMPKPTAYIVGGIIWGVWHTPAIIDGLNFGKDYAGYPYVGILLMCLFCTGTGIIFTWLTEKTNSVYPAAFAHAVNNNATPLIMVISASGNMVRDFSVSTAGVFVVALLCITADFFDKNTLKSTKRSDM